MTGVTVFGTVAGAIVAWAGSETARGAWRRWLWTLAASLMVVHSVAAFATMYGWSHDVAVAETRRQTRALTGVDSGTGLYVNYTFLAYDIWLTAQKVGNANVQTV